MVPLWAARAKVVVGSLTLVAIPAALLVLLAAPGVRRPLGRTLEVVGRDLFPSGDADRGFDVADVRGVRRGLPAFVVDADGRGRPAAHVLSVSAAEGAGRVVLRFEPGEDAGASWRLDAYPPSRTLGEALAMAVPEETADRLGREASERAETTFKEAILPEVERRLPAFLKRIDPTKDPAAKETVDRMGAAVIARLEPLLGSLSGAVTKAMDDRFDFLDRVGLLWKMLRGDAKGLRKDLEPVAKEAARRWWTTHQREVLTALGRGVEDAAPDFATWLKGPAWNAAKEEVLEPVFEAQRERLEDEAEALLRRAVEEVVVAPSGTFRVRFAGILRTHLLGKKTALLLLARTEDGP
jgi:hypothetical protein